MRKIEKFKVLLNGTDTRGNRMEFLAKTGEVKLYTVDGSILSIGRIVEEGVGSFVYKKIEDETQRHRRTNSWSINTRILKCVDLVEYTTYLAVYRSHRSDILKNSVYFHSEEGLDHKTFLPVHKWEYITFKDPMQQKLSEKLSSEWVMHLGGEFKKDYMVELNKFLWKARKERIVYPEPEDVFTAFKITDFSDVKVVILGQDPYYNGSAHGLAFSSIEQNVPKSLANIFKEIEKDIGGGLLLNQDPNLTRWAEQGVFLLNTILTVDEGKPLSHIEKGWEVFTRRVLELLSNGRKGVVYMLWGKYAQNYEKFINSSDNLILKAEHPSSSTAEQGFFGCKHFSQANDFLHYNKKGAIQW